MSLELLHDVSSVVVPQVRMTAKAAIERAHNELARFVEREQARQDVNIHIVFLFIIVWIWDL